MGKGFRKVPIQSLQRAFYAPLEAFILYSFIKLNICISGEITMSTEENKAVLRRHEEAFNNGDLAVADETIAPNYVYHGSGGQEFKGPEGFKQIITMMHTAFPDLHFTIEDMVAEGDKMVSHPYTLEKQ